MDHNQLRDDIQNFSLDNCPLGNQGYNRVLLQLFGYVGHGKSALINSLIYVLNDGKFIKHAETEEKYGWGSVTRERRAYELTPTITVVDNRPVLMMDNSRLGTVYAQLGNFMPLNETVEWYSKYEDFVSQLEDSELEPNFTDFIVPVLVHMVTLKISKWEMSELKDVFINCRSMTGVFPIVVLTFKTRENYIEVEKMFRSLGAEVVVAVENYTHDDQIQTLGRSRDFLTLLKSALDDVTFRMGQPRNPKEERQERKKFLLKCVHDFETKRRVSEFEIKKMLEAKNSP